MKLMGYRTGDSLNKLIFLIPVSIAILVVAGVDLLTHVLVGQTSYRDAVVVQETQTGTTHCWMLQHVASAGSWSHPEAWFTEGNYGFFIYGGIVNYIRDTNANWTPETFAYNARLLGVNDPSTCKFISGDRLKYILL